MNTSIIFAEEVLREAALIPYVNSSETVAFKEALMDATLPALGPHVNSSYTAASEEPKEVAVAASVPCAHSLVTAAKEDLREVLSVSRVNNSETAAKEEPKKAASVSRDVTSATVAAEEDLAPDPVDTDTKESVSVNVEMPVPPAADSSVAASSAASEVQNNVIVCEVPKVENVNVIGNLCNAETSGVKKSHVTANVTDLLLIDCKVSEDILRETIMKEKSDLDVSDVPNTRTGIDLNTTESFDVSEVTSKKRHSRTPVPKARKCLCTCGADPSTGTLKKKPPTHGCGGSAGPALGRKEVRGRSMDRMHDSRYGEITVSVGAYERLLCYGDSLVRLGGADDFKNTAGINISRKMQPNVTIASFGVTSWDLPSYDVPVQRNEQEMKPATATAVSAPASADILDLNYPENSDGAFNTVKRRPRRAKLAQKEQKSVSCSAKEQTELAKVVHDVAGDSSNAVKGVVTEKCQEKVTDGLGGTSLNKTSRSPRHKSRKNHTLQDVPDQERSVLNLPGPSKPVPNLVDDPSGLIQESTDQILEPQRPSGLTQESKNLVPLQQCQVDQDIPCGKQSALVHRASEAAVVPVSPGDQFLEASHSAREPQHVDLLIGHTSGSGSMDLCYLRDNEANLEYTLVRRHFCGGNYMGPSEEGRFCRSSAEYMTLGVEDLPKWERDESRGVEELDLAKAGSYSSSMVVDPVKLELVEPSSGYDDLPLLGIGDVDNENPLMQGAQIGSVVVNESSNMFVNEAECIKSVNPDFTGITYLDGLKSHLKVLNSGETDASVCDIPLISKKSCIGSSDLLSAKKLDDFSDFLENIGVVSVSAEPEKTPTAMIDFRGVKEKKPEPAYLLELKAKLNIGDAVPDKDECDPSYDEVVVANLIHLDATEISVQESRTERSVKFNGAQIRDEFIEPTQVVDCAPRLSGKDPVVETNEAASFYNMPHLMYKYFVKTKQDDNALEILDDQSLENTIDQEALDESYEAIHSEEERAPFQGIKPADEFSQLFKLEEISVKSSECDDKYLSNSDNFDEAQYAELSTCHPGSASSQAAQPRGSGSSDQLFPYNLVIDNPVYSSLSSTTADSTGLFKGMCLANGVHDIELAETESLSKEVVSDEYRNYLQDIDQPTMSSYGAGTVRRSTSSTVRIQKDFRKKMDRFLTQNIRFHQQPKYDTALSLQNKMYRSGARGSSTGAAGSNFHARPSRPLDSRQPHRYPPAGSRRPEGAGSGVGGFPEQYSARLAEQLRLLMQEESRQLHLLQREQRANLSEGALRDALLDRDIEQDVQQEIEALERSLKIKEQQLLQLEEMQLRIQLEQMPSASRIEGSNQRQCQSFGEIENVIQQTVFLESSSPSPVMKKTRSEPYLTTPSLSGSNHPSDDLGESPATLPRTQSPGRMHEYVNWTPEDVRSLSTSKSKRRSQSSSRRTSSRSVASHSFSSEVLQQLENLRLELQRAEEAIQQRLDGVCISSRRSTLDMSADSSDERLVEDSGMLPHQRKAGENQRQHKEKHCCRNEKPRHQEEKHSHQEEKHSHQEKKHSHQEEKHSHQEEKHSHQEEKRSHQEEKRSHQEEKRSHQEEKHSHQEKKHSHQENKHRHHDEKHRYHDEKHRHHDEKHRHQEEKHHHQLEKHRHHDEKHHHKNEKHLHRDVKHRHEDEYQRHHAGDDNNDEQLRYHHDEQPQRNVDEPQQHHLVDQRLHHFDEQQQRHRDERQQCHRDEQHQRHFDEQQQHRFDEQQQRHFDEKQHRHFAEQKQEHHRLSDAQQAEQDHQERTLEQEKLHYEHKHKQRSKHQKQHEPEQKLYENTRQRIPDGALLEDLGEQNQHICGDEPNENEEKAHGNRESEKQQHDGYDETRRSRHNRRRDRRNKDHHHQDDSGVLAPKSEELLQSHDELQAYHHLAVMEHWQDQVIAEQPLQFYQQLISDQHVISEQPIKQVMMDHGPEQQFGAPQTEQEHEQLEVLLLQEQQQKQLMVERYAQQQKENEHNAQQPHVYENQHEHQYEEKRLCEDSLKEQQLASKYQKQQPIVQHQSAMSKGGLMKPGLGACAGLLRAGFEIGLSTLVGIDQECDKTKRIGSLATAPASFRKEGGTNEATAEKPLHGLRTYVEVQPQVLDDDTFHEKFLHEQQDELTRRALAERLTRSVEQLNASGASSCRQQDQLRVFELADNLTVHPIGSETPAIESDRRNDVLKTRNLHNDCQVHGLGRSYPDLEYARAFRHSGDGRGDVVPGNAARGVTISAEALLSKHTYVNSQDKSSFDPKRDFEAAHQLLLDMESTDPVVPAPAPAKPKRVSYGDERSGESYYKNKEKLAHQLLPKVPALESRESDPVILGPHLHHSYMDDATDAKDNELCNDMEDESPATPSPPPPPPAITRQYPANVLQELQLLTLQLQDTERMISRKLDLLVSPPQSRVGSAAPRPPKAQRFRNSHQRVSSLGSTGLTTFDYQNNNNSKNEHYSFAGGDERPRRSNSVGCSDMITAAYCNKGRAAPSHKSPRDRVRPKTAPKVRQPTSIKGNKATPKEELRSSQEEDGNDSSLCFAHIKKFWEKEKT